MTALAGLRAISHAGHTATSFAVLATALGAHRATIHDHFTRATRLRGASRSPRSRRYSTRRCLGSRWAYLRGMEIAEFLKRAWAHAYPGREVAERNALLRELRMLLVVDVTEKEDAQTRRATRPRCSELS